MLNYTKLRRDQIDDERWNDLILSDPSFRHYALTYFLDGACECWSALVGKDYEWVWPLPEMAFPLKRVFQPLLAQQLGPYGRPLTETELELVWKDLRQSYRQVRIKFNDAYHALPFPTKEHVNVELSLKGDYDAMVQGYNRNITSNLKKAQKASVQVSRGSDFDPWCIETFRKGRAKDLSDLTASFYHHVESIYKGFEQRDQGTIYTARHNGKKVAQLMLLTSSRRLLLFFSATSSSARGIGAMHSIIDKVIQDHAGQDMVFDLEGSDNEQLAFFYQSFGGEEKVYLQAETDRLFWPLNIWIK